MGYKISIDGPSGAGKGCVAKGLSERLDVLNIDTGAMYRTLALYCIENGINIDDEKEVVSILKDIDIYLKNENSVVKAFLNDVDVSHKIRTEQVGFVAAKVSRILAVREYMREKQRAMAGTQNIVAEGRDIGSVVFPDADLKIFLKGKLAEYMIPNFLIQIDKLSNKTIKIVSYASILVTIANLGYFFLYVYNYLGSSIFDLFR